ncbi:MAG: hypothetical protein ABH862_06830 [Candidatus Omnitrophota bacterium]
MKNSVRPIVNAMLICDKVITEADTNKKSLIGIFGNINAFKFPCIHNFLSVYIKFTDAIGEYNFHLELIDLENNSVVGRSDIPKEIAVTDPLATHDLVFNLSALKFMHPGKYEFRIFANDAIFGQKTFLVNKMEAPASEAKP